jgi:peroxiredoxin 2/4
MSVLVGRKAPDFKVAAVLANGEIVDNYQFLEVIHNKYAVLFFYPLDFTFVCPSELIALNNRAEQFSKLGVELVGVSIDSQFTHTAWRNTPLNQGGIGSVDFTLVADINHHVCQSYGVEHPVAGVALRATFIIDAQGMVCSQTVNDLPLGRNIDETLRTIEALQFYEQHGEVCPAGWSKGKQGMKPTHGGVSKYLAEHAEDL